MEAAVVGSSYGEEIGEKKTAAKEGGEKGLSKKKTSEPIYNTLMTMLLAIAFIFTASKNKENEEEEEGIRWW